MITELLVLLAFPALALGVFVEQLHRKGSVETATVLTVWLGVSVAIGIVGGIGHTWGILSFLGKSAALVIAAGLPLLAASVGVWFGRRRAWSQRATTTAALLGGLPFVVLFPIVGLLLACALTGDCP